MPEGSSKDADQSLRSLQTTPFKRKCDDEGHETDSENEVDEDYKRRKITEDELAQALTDLTSHSKRFDVETTKMTVQALLQWHYTPTSQSSQLVYDKKYQREHNFGWDSEKKAQYLRTVMAGQAATPFVANEIRKQARLMDGGHRLDTIAEFYKGHIAMDIKGYKVYFPQLTQFDQDYFLSRKLQVMTFSNLPFKDEVEFFMQLNSGLPLSAGERLFATTSCNPATKLADLVCKEESMSEHIKKLCTVFRKGTTGCEAGRKNELLSLAFFVVVMIFPKDDNSVNLTMADAFLQDVCKLNQAAEWNDSRKHDGKTLVELKEKVQELLPKVLDIYNAVKRPACPSHACHSTFRCMVCCMLAVRELAQDELEAPVLSKLLSEATENSGKIFKKMAKVLKEQDIKEFVQAYRDLRRSLSGNSEAPSAGGA